MTCLSPQQTSHSVPENAPTGPDNPFFNVAGRDTDVSDASNLFYHLVVDGYAFPNECGDVFCVGLTSANLYFNKPLVSFQVEK